MRQPHITSAFDQDIDGLYSRILTMGGMVEQAISEAGRALESRDDERAAEVIRADREIDAMEDDINTAVVSTIALRQPAAADLRAVVTVMKMAGDLERLGDYAKNMAKRVPVLAQAQGVDGAGAALRRQSRLVQLMLKDALDGFARGDLDLVRDVIQRDVEVDQMTNALFREFLTHMMEDPRAITPCLHFLFISKNLERMGDHVTEICEQVIYLETGARPELRPKGDVTSQMTAEQGGA
ncbi:phosphate signaling complex protein PhoU [Rhodobaculum claviforme]|uniref:Phosphate-specific transport system accessory protein PhoU n=1 Tax=Rhodobaculum claviforme TaxID=1549854 RepID=A0A934WHW4_9RHOB|nr:phosphate signaling complex protein PhoU [Rhodobaculum claviforme]MBK5926221.1 phosphate transport system regulatory protein PhoU [Rhodobaculum claviforme]